MHKKPVENPYASTRKAILELCSTMTQQKGQYRKPFCPTTKWPVNEEIVQFEINVDI